MSTFQVSTLRVTTLQQSMFRDVMPRGDMPRGDMAAPVFLERVGESQVPPNINEISFRAHKI